jgi:hypothetical protein
MKTDLQQGRSVFNLRFLRKNSLYLMHKIISLDEKKNKVRTYDNIIYSASFIAILIDLLYSTSIR